ncbi:MAG TPA: hypothetical protein VLV78_15785 [Thermoanaerobaculia bacterium]|nr:hypothetical protein [Thermoanaerobaculia bacterium]
MLDPSKRALSCRFARRHKRAIPRNSGPLRPKRLPVSLLGGLCPSSFDLLVAESGLAPEIVGYRVEQDAAARDMLQGFVGHGNIANEIEHCPRPALSQKLFHPLVRVPDMLHLVGELGLEERRKLRIIGPPRGIQPVLDGVQSGGLEAAVLHSQSAGQGAQIGNDAVLKVHDRKLTDDSAATLEQLPEGDDVTSFIPALPGELHPHFPVRVWKIRQAARTHLDAVHFLVHLTVQEFEILARVIRREVLHF